MNELKTWWFGLSSRERQMLIAAFMILTFGGFYAFVYQPLNSKLDQAQEQLTSEQSLNAWLVNKANTITTLRSQGAVGLKATDSDSPLNQVISTTAQRYNVDLIRMQPRENMIQVWVQPLSFNALVNWLDELNKNQGLDVLYLDVKEGSAPGMVEVERLQLERAQ